MATTTPTSTANKLHDTGTIHEWRLKVLNGILRGIFIFASPVLVFGLINVAQDYHLGSPLFQAVILASLYIVAYFFTIFVTFVPRAGYNLRAGISLALLFVLGTANLAMGGLSSDGLLFIFASVALAALLFDFRYPAIPIGISMATGVIMAWLMVSGRIRITTIRITHR